MSDEDIKKSLFEIAEKAANQDDIYFDGHASTELSKLLHNTLALINRQQAEIGVYETCNARKDESIRHLEAEIERLKAEIKGFDNFLRKTDCSLKEIRDNAIKEFAERLKSTYRIKERYCDNTKFVIRTFRNSIDSLLAEMVGEQDV